MGSYHNLWLYLCLLAISCNMVFSQQAGNRFPDAVPMVRSSQTEHRLWLHKSWPSILGQRNSMLERSSLHTASDHTPSTPFEGSDSRNGVLSRLYAQTAWIPHGADLTPALPHNLTNGKSALGTRQAYKRRGQLPQVMGQKRATTPISGFRVIPAYIPETGVTHRYSFSLGCRLIAPDGVSRQGIVVNDAFPGPTIEADIGDWVAVQVTNNLEDQGTSIHYHGLLQKETPWSDGVPSVHQCPIAPGGSYTYRFRADQIGTSWWHSHVSAQYTNGAFGAIVIRGEDDGNGYDEDLGPVFLSDWYHGNMDDLVRKTMHNPQSRPPPSDNNLINGKMNFPCLNGTIANGITACTPNAGLSKFYFSPGKKYRMRLINAGAAGTQHFSIDKHSFTIIAQDFVPIKPYQNDLITLSIGQRTDVIVEATGELGTSYWMRSDQGPAGVTDGACTVLQGQPVAYAAVYYSGANENSVPNTTSSIVPQRVLPCYNDPLNKTEPIEVVSSDPIGDLTTVELHTNFTQVLFSNGSCLNKWTVNGIAYHADYSQSLLSDVQASNFTPKSEMNLYDLGSNGTVRLIIYNHFPRTNHPMHLHGYNFQVLAEGSGTWDRKITRPDNPSRRDVQNVNKALPDGTPSYAVIQFFTDNPGMWPLHCHLVWHNSAGLFINLLIKPEEVNKLRIPEDHEQLCKDWNAFYVVGHPEQLDAGV